MHPQNKQFPVFDAAIGILQVEPAGPNGFHLGARQGYTRFVGLFHKKVMPRFFVLRQQFCPVGHCAAPFLSLFMLPRGKLSVK